MTSNVIMNAVKYMPKEATLMQVEEAIERYKKFPNEKTEHHLVTTMMMHVMKCEENNPDFIEAKKKMFSND